MSLLIRWATRAIKKSQGKNLCASGDVYVAESGSDYCRFCKCWNCNKKKAKFKKHLCDDCYDLYLGKNLEKNNS